MNPLPQLVSNIQADLGSMDVFDIADKHNVPMRMVQDVKKGRYARHVRLTRGRKLHEIQLYDQKGYTPSGKSLQGALEITEDGLSLKCHECGEWVDNLANHIKEHGIKARDYKVKHGLKLTSCLLNEPDRIAAAKQGMMYWKSLAPAQHAAIKLNREAGKKSAKAAKDASDKTHHGHSMTLNIRGKCPVQTLHDYRALCQSLGRAATHRECYANNISVWMLRHNYGGVAKAAKLCGFKPANDGMQKAVHQRKQKGKPVGAGRQWYTREELLGYLLAFDKKHGRTPTESDCKRGLLPTRKCYASRFGSWSRAIQIAGLTPVRKPAVQHWQIAAD